VVPRDPQQRSECKGNQHGQRKILENLLRRALFEQFLEDVALPFIAEDLVTPVGDTVGRVVELLQVAEMEGVLDEIAQKSRTEMNESRPERRLVAVSVQDERKNIRLQFVEQLLDEYVPVLKIPVDGPRRLPRPVRQ